MHIDAVTFITTVECTFQSSWLYNCRRI